MKVWHILKSGRSHSVSAKHILLFLVFVVGYIPVARKNF